MPITVREAHAPEDTAKMWSVWAWVYRLQAPQEPYDEKGKNDHWYIAEDQGAPVAACTVKDYTVARGAADLRCGGVAGVATLSEHRGKGHGTQLMLGALRLMRERGQVVSSLYAFRDPFYAKVGYGTCGWRWKIACPVHRIPKTKCDLPVRQVAPEDVHILSDAHTKFVRGFSGSPIRTEVEWKTRLGQKPPLVYAVGDPIEAYLWVRITEFWGNVDVGELAWTTPRGYDAALAVLRGIAHNQKTVTWMEPPDSRFLALHFDQGVEMSLYRQTMHRVLDVPGALRQLKPQDKGEFTIHVTDPHIAENDGAWRVAFSPGGVEVEKTDNAKIACDIGAFSQALMGAPSLRELAEKQVVRANDAKHLQSAQALLDPMTVCCMEFF